MCFSGQLTKEDHRPEHCGKPGMNLSITLSGSDPLAFRGKKALGSPTERGAGVGMLNRNSRYSPSYCSAGTDGV